MYALTHCRIYSGYDYWDDHAILIDGNQIVGICAQESIPAEVRVIDLHGARVAPGFIDIQLNGCGGVQFNETLDALSIETLEKMQYTNLRYGCTSYLPTLITATDPFIYRAIETMECYLKTHANQALGLHIEGPYLSQAKKGIHRSEYIRKPDRTMIDYFCDHAAAIKIVTLAPEEVETSLIQQLAETGIRVSIGHTNATYAQTKIALAAGASMATHLFNAMPPINGREPGVVGAVYDSPETYAGVIADGLHLDWATLRFSHQIKPEHLILTTDAILLAGTDLPSGAFAGTTIFNQNGKCVDEHGTLGGSSLTMIDAVKNTVNYAGIALDEALRMATLYPAKALGIEDHLGVIGHGKVANLVIFDHNFSVIHTIVNGDRGH